MQSQSPHADTAAATPLRLHPCPRLSLSAHLCSVVCVCSRLHCPREIILTFGTSHTVQSFLKEAAKFRKFEVIVAESAPSYSGHTMALALKELGIETTLISDSAVFAMMPSVNKVIVGTHGVMANGGLIAHTGAANIAQAAKYHSVPFVVITGLHKLCPLYAFDSDTFNEQNAPSQLLKFDELAFDGAPVPASAASAEGADTDPASLLNILNPAFDYVEPTLVSLFISNMSVERRSTATGREGQALRQHRSRNCTLCSVRR